MKHLPFALLLLITSGSAIAQESTSLFCDPEQESTRVHIPSDEGSVPATLCRNGDDALLLPDAPVSRQHLLYFGLNLGLPFLGYEATYVQRRESLQYFHAALAIEGSLGGTGVTLRGGIHPWRNSAFVGGTTRMVLAPNNRNGFMLGPTLGLSGGRGLINGQIGIGLLGSWAQNTQRVGLSPEVTLGLRIRIYRH